MIGTDMGKTLNTMPMYIRVKTEPFYWVHRHFQIGYITHKHAWFWDEEKGYTLIEVVDRVYEDHCTCGVSENSIGVVKANGKIDPCYRKVFKNPENNFELQENKPGWKGNRKITKANLKNSVKSFNSNEEKDDDFVSEYAYYTKTPRQWIY